MIRTHSLSYALMLAVAGTLALAGCKKQEPAPAETTPPPAAPAEPAPAATPAPAAVTVTGITIGTSAAADKSVAAAASIQPTDPIIVSVKTDGAASSASIGAKLVFEDGQTAGEQSATLATSGPETTNITFTNTKPWPAGKYTAQVTLDGQPAGEPQSFEVK